MGEYLYKSDFTALCSPHFPPDLGGLKKWAQRRKLSPLFSVSLIFLLQWNYEKQHFSLYFPLLIFHIPYFHPNQTHSKAMFFLFCFILGIFLFMVLEVLVLAPKSYLVTLFQFSLIASFYTGPAQQLWEFWAKILSGGLFYI